MEEVQRLEKILREKGLTEEQVKAGVKYYLNFCKRHDLNLAKSVRMIVQMVKGMREYYEKIS
ncbi:MAG: hypothetical protein FGF53_09370 [Candidatus Brockarchaeota archaeon]|nr:hypothetical protein [Candidatus Brockarchaeota archaeon]